jgi:16S rRNA processing protein RimM
MAERIALGRIGRAHGVDGAFRVWPYADNTERFSLLHDVVLINGKRVLKAVVKSVRVQRGFVVVQTEQIQTPEDVRPWINGDLEIDESERIELLEGEYFHDDIIGLRVETVDGQTVGEIVSIIDGVANDVYVCRNGDAEHLIPAVDRFVKVIDIAKGVMIIDPIPGMID